MTRLPSKGIYLLEFYALQNFTLNIPKFSDTTFPSGWYYYVGSAQKNLQHRIVRHLKKNKKIHWHIDHVTTHDQVEMKRIFVFLNAEKSLEWKLAKDLINHYKCEVIVKGFGNSDTNRTDTHFVHLSKKIYFSHLTSRYQSIVRLIPSSIDIS